MLRETDNHVICGAIIDNGEVTELFCNLDTGDIAYEGTMDGVPILVGEISIEDPLPQTDIIKLSRQLEDGYFGDALGVILRSTNMIVILPNECAEERSFIKPTIPTGKTFPIDLDQEYVTV